MDEVKEKLKQDIEHLLRCAREQSETDFNKCIQNALLNFGTRSYDEALKHLQYAYTHLVKASMCKQEIDRFKQL